MTLLGRLFKTLNSRRFTTRVAVLLVFLLSTHSFLCILGAHLLGCDEYAEMSGPVATLSAQLPADTPQAAPVHDHADVCCQGIDENKIPGTIVTPPQPIFTVTYALWAVLLTMLAPLVPAAAALFDRDGDVTIPDLHGLILRACLPHRAPPVFLA